MCIGGSVGRGCVNLANDVKTVQILLDLNLSRLRPPGRLAVDGVMGDETLAAIEAFQTRGGMLEALVEDTQATQLHSAAETFVTSLRKVPDVSLSLEASDAVSEAIVLGGETLVEAKKARAIKAIVPKTRPAIDRICDTLTRDFRRSRVNRHAEFGRVAVQG